MTDTNQSRHYQVRVKRDYTERSRIETFFPKTFEDMKAAWLERQARYRKAAELSKLLPPPPPPPPEPLPRLPMIVREWRSPDQSFPNKRSLQIIDIQRAVCAHFGIRMVDLVSHRRTMAVVRPRQLAMYLCRILTTRSLPDIGRRFEGRDHTTVFHAINVIEGLLKVDPMLEASAMMLTERLGQ